ncbi:hypothetical protein V5799_022094 [Amblyomma americanum]|uniref:Carboxypeptidase n=1 Tax=Amblyomma americanum TaxID=6943 RepID=A0AAQ4FLH8_AMBAM
MLIKVLLGVWVVPLLALGFNPSDWEVTDLPGLYEEVNFRHYSGFLSGAEGRKLHYWFMESQRSPSDDPVLLWLNGGPGCSSLVAAVTELGPFSLGPLGVNMTLNPFSWNQVANVIFLESPAGVGYSYDPTGVYVTNDTKTTEDNYLAVLDFFEKFPEFKENEFYITGESYAGVYIPLLARRFLHDSRGVNLKGFAIGNGALDYELHGKGIIFFGYYHALFGDDLWDQITSNCCNNSISKDTCDFGWTTTDPACTEPVSIAYDIYLNRGLNLYNLYVPCGTVEGLPTSLSSRHPEVTSQYASKELLRKILRLPTSMEKTNSASPNCYNQDHLLLYYNRRDVIEALHVEESPLRWVPCTDTLNYTQQYETVREVVRELIDSDRLRALIYNGDVDMACPFLSNGWFVRSLGVTPTSVYKMWHTGTAIPVISGFVQTFTKNVTFATVLGAGHKAPMDKPAEALHMITNFLSQTPLE